MKNGCNLLNYFLIFMLLLALFKPEMIMAEQAAHGQKKPGELVKEKNKNTDDNEKDPKYWYNKGVL